MNYFKRPEMVKAIQWDGRNTGEIINFTVGKAKLAAKKTVFASKDFLTVFTYSGERTANVSDYIIKDSDGSLSVCNAYEFRKNYEKFDDGIDVSVERKFINEPKAIVKRTITNKKIKAEIVSQDGCTRLYIDGKEIKNITDIYFTHDESENTSILNYTAIVENAFEE